MQSAGIAPLPARILGNFAITFCADLASALGELAESESTERNYSLALRYQVFDPSITPLRRAYLQFERRQTKNEYVAALNRLAHSESEEQRKVALDNIDIALENYLHRGTEVLTPPEASFKIDGELVRLDIPEIFIRRVHVSAEKAVSSWWKEKITENGLDYDASSALANSYIQGHQQLSDVMKELRDYVTVVMKCDSEAFLATVAADEVNLSNLMAALGRDMTFALIIGHNLQQGINPEFSEFINRKFEGIDVESVQGVLASRGKLREITELLASPLEGSLYDGQKGYPFNHLLSHPVFMRAHPLVLGERMLSEQVEGGVKESLRYCKVSSPTLLPVQPGLKLTTD